MRRAWSHVASWAQPVVLGLARAAHPAARAGGHPPVQHRRGHPRRRRAGAGRRRLALRRGDRPQAAAARSPSTPCSAPRDLRPVRVVVALLVLGHGAGGWPTRPAAGGAAAAGWAAGLVVVLGASALGPDDAQAANFELFALLPDRRGGGGGGPGPGGAGRGGPGRGRAVQAAGGRDRSCRWRGAGGRPAGGAAWSGPGRRRAWPAWCSPPRSASRRCSSGRCSAPAATWRLDPSDVGFVALRLPGPGGARRRLLGRCLAAGRRPGRRRSTAGPHRSAATGAPPTDRRPVAARSAPRCLGVVAGFRFFPHYLLQLLPALALLAGRGVVRRPARAAPGGGAGASAAAVVAAGAGLVGGLAAPAELRDRPGRLRPGPHRPPSRQILVWGNVPEVYWRADRQPAGGFTHTEFVTGYSGGRRPRRGDRGRPCPTWTLYRDWIARLRADPPHAGLRHRGGRPPRRRVVPAPPASRPSHALLDERYRAGRHHRPRARLPRSRGPSSPMTITRAQLEAMARDRPGRAAVARGLAPGRRCPASPGCSGATPASRPCSCCPRTRPIAAATIRALAVRQGRVFDRRREEEPGKIAHEVPVRPGGPASGWSSASGSGGASRTTAASTPPPGGSAWWTATWPHRRRRPAGRGDPEPATGPADWMAGCARIGVDDFVAYQRRNPAGLLHQGWRDSDLGTVPIVAPVALVEAQGYYAEAAAALVRLGHRRARRGRTATAAAFDDGVLDARARAPTPWRSAATARSSRIVTSNAGPPPRHAAASTTTGPRRWPTGCSATTSGPPAASAPTPRPTPTSTATATTAARSGPTTTGSSTRAWWPSAATTTPPGSARPCSTPCADLEHIPELYAVHDGEAAVPRRCPSRCRPGAAAPCCRSSTAERAD